jgi:hypothetical protein
MKSLALAAILIACPVYGGSVQLLKSLRKSLL